MNEVAKSCNYFKAWLLISLLSNKLTVFMAFSLLCLTFWPLLDHNLAYLILNILRWVGIVLLGLVVFVIVVILYIDLVFFRLDPED